MRFGETASDIAFLADEPYSDLPDDWALTCLPPTTRLPVEGDVLTVVGFCFDNAHANDLPQIEGIPVIGRERLYVSAGTAQQVQSPRRSSAVGARAWGR